MSNRGGKRPGAGRPKGSKNKVILARQTAIADSGLSPVEYMLNIVRDEGQKQEARLEAAKAVAPYIHPRLQSIESQTVNTTTIKYADKDMLDNAIEAANEIRKV